MATKTKGRKSAQARATNDGANPHEVTIRHGLFRYHVVTKTATGQDSAMIRHAERGQTVFVNDEDYDRGMEYGAFIEHDQAEQFKRAVAPAGHSKDPAGDASEGDDLIDFGSASDEEIQSYLERHTTDEIIVKTQGEDLKIVEKVLGIEYQITDGDPRPEIKDQLVDLLGENPEEDDEGNWVNEPELDEEKEGDAVKAETRKARRGAGRKATARSATS
jgi:hypothetical protein